MKQVAAVLLNYMSWEETLEQAEFLRKNFHGDELEIIIVDNASPNESAVKLQAAAVDKYIFLKSDRNGGYASGNNIGLRYAYEKGIEYAWIMNSDIEIRNPRELLEAMLMIFEKDKMVAVVNPDIVDGDGREYNRDSNRPSFWDLTLGMITYQKRGRKLKDRGGYAYVYRPQGCCMLLDLKKIKSIDYMDEKTFLYYEEYILSERLLRKGYRNACCFEYAVIHHDSVTVRGNNKSKQIRKYKADSFRYYLNEYRNFNGFEKWACCRFAEMKQLALDARRSLRH